MRCSQARQAKESKKAAAGVVIEEADGRIWLVSPINAFGGCQQTCPKSKVDVGLSLQAVAIKEGFEESGLQVQITGTVGDFERSTSFCRSHRQASWRHVGRLRLGIASRASGAKKRAAGAAQYLERSKNCQRDWRGRIIFFVRYRAGQRDFTRRVGALLLRWSFRAMRSI
jgi:ADP-ribose pyrophosphatase YjhB (NUDIX family)